MIRDAVEVDEALARLAKFAGDEAGWRILYTRLWPFVLSITMRMMRHAESAEDVAQETFIRLARYFPFDRGIQQNVFLLYVAQVARHASLDALHRRRRDVVGLDDIPEPVDPADRPGDVAEVASTVAWLKQRLKPDEARLFRNLVEQSPLELSELAGELGISYSAAGVRLHRLRARVRKLLGME